MSQGLSWDCQSRSIAIQKKMLLGGHKGNTNILPTYDHTCVPPYPVKL